MTAKLGWGTALSILVLLTANGCCCVGGGLVSCDGGCGYVDAGGCGGGCGGACGAPFAPLLRSGPLFGGYFMGGACGQGDVGCTGCGGGCGDSSCGGGSCGGCGGCGSPFGYGPIRSVLGLIAYGLTGGYGCGPTYYGEWISDPPNCHDPCCEFCGAAGGCGGTCTSGTCGGGCSDCGGTAYAEPSYNWGHGTPSPASSCPDGSCAQTGNEEVIIGQADGTSLTPVRQVVRTQASSRPRVATGHNNRAITYR
ncbi:MAG: hypothetical protein KDA60_18675 [Planctomycetales bacterium]|nr:hypothetical protein [Planctomycetales bacterium]